MGIPDSLSPTLPNKCDAEPMTRGGLGQAEEMQEDLEEMDVPLTHFFEDALGAGDCEYDRRGYESDD